ncbi:MAG: hypothetical protein ACJAVW_003183 [Spirosomataceae bacterium]
MKLLSILFCTVTTLILGSCGSNEEEKDSSLTFPITNLSDEDYPDNPDIGFRSKEYQNDFFTTGEIDSTAQPFVWNFVFRTKSQDSITFKDIDISEFLPTIPTHVKQDDYLSFISCVNQEWNRNQVQFNNSQYKSTDSKIVRIDIARNCLNTYLWEVIAYIEEGGKTVPYAHGWFDFPHEQYVRLFEAKNDVPFTKYKENLESWADPESKKVDLDVLRTLTKFTKVDFTDKSDAMYPQQGARKKKFKEIIYPETFNTMRDLQSDSTLFATFTPPGFYNRKDPRTTELGRFYHLKSAEVNEVKSKANGKAFHEVKLTFTDKNDGRETTLLIGGLNFEDFPVLATSEANSGWKNSMGISNHTFYEKYEEHLKNKSTDSPYYALLLDENGKWLDSHKVGIDGPIFHFTDKNKTTLNLWLLSFERHALVGHYEMKVRR